MTEQLFIYFNIALALALVWPRGYLLVYVIDRTKSFNFGTKFFLGWIFGMSAFTLDVFGANVLGGFPLSVWLFLFSALSQIVGLEIFIYILERKLLLPKPHHALLFMKRMGDTFASMTQYERLGVLVLVATVLLVATTALYRPEAITQFDQRVEQIFQERQLLTAGSEATNYPLNNTLFKVWIATMAGEFSYFYISIADIFYFVIMVALFYWMMPSSLGRLIKQTATTVLAMVLLVYFMFEHNTSHADLLFSIFSFAALVSLVYAFWGRGKSYYYLSSMNLAFAIWTQNEGLWLLFPVIFIGTVYMWLVRKVMLFDFALSWFFAVLTMLPWITFIATRNITLADIDFNSFKFVNFFGVTLMFGVYIIWSILQKRNGKSST